MSKKFLTLSIGASAVALAEYEASGSRLTLLNYGTAALAAPLDQGDTDAILSPALLEIVREKGIRPGKVAVALSGQMVFPRFAAIPFAGSDEAKFDQMVRYEIEQNIPFPIDEMVCDRQMLGETPNGDKAVLIVAAKVEQVEAITSTLAATGFEPALIDVGPLAVTNALRASVPDDGSCSLILDIGAKATSFVIAEGERLYIRTIPNIAGNTITKEIAQALGCTQEEAEGVKRERAYVSMGGVTEDEDETRDRISKVCRAVLTRLHAEIARSVNFYRSQQGGSAPAKLYLTGGTTLLPQLAEFFSESLEIEVEYLDPFQAIAPGPAIDAEALQADTPFLAATAGLAVHMAGAAQLDINLMPPSLLEARAERAKIPFVAAGALALVAAGACLFLAARHCGEVSEAREEAANECLGRLKTAEGKVTAARTASEKAEKDATALRGVIASRNAAVVRLNVVRQALGDDLWIEKWEDGKITVRGWKDRVAAFVARAAGKDGDKPKTAPEIVVERLKASAPVNPASVRVADMTEMGKGGCLVQFAVEVKFK